MQEQQRSGSHVRTRRVLVQQLQLETMRVALPALPLLAPPAQAAGSSMLDDQ